MQQTPSSAQFRCYHWVLSQQHFQAPNWGHGEQQPAPSPEESAEEHHYAC